MLSFIREVILLEVILFFKLRYTRVGHTIVFPVQSSSTTWWLQRVLLLLVPLDIKLFFVPCPFIPAEGMSPLFFKQKL